MNESNESDYEKHRQDFTAAIENYSRAVGLFVEEVALDSGVATSGHIVHTVRLAADDIMERRFIREPYMIEVTRRELQEILDACKVEGLLEILIAATDRTDSSDLIAHIEPTIPDGKGRDQRATE